MTGIDEGAGLVNHTKERGVRGSWGGRAVGGASGGEVIREGAVEVIQGGGHYVYN